MPAPELTDTEPLRDSALLREYAAAGSRAAFTEMVRRHRGLVFSTALRITGEHTMAEEAAQNAFAILARKAAAVARCDQPGAWLYRTTVFEAKKRLRSETRHRRRLAALEAESSTMNAPATTDTPLSDLLPHVDECIQRLRPAEQDAIRMRYMEDRSYADIAAVLGKSEEAGKKHTARALERLCSLLRRRGVVSAAALTASLQAGSRTASAISAESLTSAALSSAATLTRGQLLLHTVHIMTTKQTAAAAAVLLLLCSTPVLWQERAIAHTRAELAAANVPPPAPAPRSAPVLLAPEQKSRIHTLMHGPPQPQTEEGPVDLKMAVAVATADDRDSDDVRPRYERMQKLGMGELQRLLAQAAALPDGDRERTQLLLVSLMADKDPQAALQAALPLCRSVGEDYYGGVLNEIGELYSLWMKKDCQAALASYEKLRAGGAFTGRGITQDGEALAADIASQCYPYSPADALRLLATLASNLRMDPLKTIAKEARPEDLAFVFAELDRLAPESSGRGWRRELLPELARGEVSRSGLDAGLKLLNEVQDSKEVRQRLLAVMLHERTQKGPPGESALEALAWARAHLPPEEAMAVSATFLGDPEFFGGTLGGTTPYEVFRAFDWGDQRDAAIVAMISAARRSERLNEIAETLSLAREITDHALKVQTLQSVAGQTPPDRRSAAFLHEINSDASLSAAERSAILNAPLHKQP